MHPKRLIAHILLVFALLPLLAWAASAEEGRQYALIENGAPWKPLDGKIEVAEVFSYRCHHCANFQPMIDAWKRKLPADVRFSYVPMPYGRDDAYARGFFAVEAAGGLNKAHAPLFIAMHQEKSMPGNASISELATWYGQHGLNAKRLEAAMAVPAMADRLASAYQFAQRNGVEGTPTLIINGRYRILGSSLGEYLQNADAVLAQVRAAGR